jgi:hypothetical protein
MMWRISLTVTPEIPFSSGAIPFSAPALAQSSANPALVQSDGAIAAPAACLLEVLFHNLRREPLGRQSHHSELHRITYEGTPPPVHIRNEEFERYQV